LTQEIKWQASKDLEGHPTQEFYVSSDTNRTVTGALWLPANNSAELLMVFGHGASDDRYQAPICELAARFVNEANIAVLSMDGPVHGLRQVGPGGREALGQEFARPSCIDDMVTDWDIAISAITDREELNISKLAYFGLSMGSIFGIPLVAHRNDFVVATLGLLGSSGAVSFLGDRITEDAAKISIPVLYLMQLEDELFDRQGYLDVFDHLASQDKRLHANPGLHPEVPQEEVDFSFEFMMKYIARELGS
jgi:pimeloyl-ACP methyl ester carboxylesterase